MSLSYDCFFCDGGRFDWREIVCLEFEDIVTGTTPGFLRRTFTWSGGWTMMSNEGDAMDDWEEDGGEGSDDNADDEDDDDSGS